MPHISFSALKTWDECPYKFKLLYQDRIEEFRGNAYTAFGSAMHEVCEKTLLGEFKNDDASANFKSIFVRELKSLPLEIKTNIDESLVKKMLHQGLALAPLAIPYLSQ